MKSCFILALISLVVWGCDRQKPPEQTSEDQSANCAAHLRMLDGAKLLWAENYQKTTNDTPKIEELKEYLRGLPACPSGGVYTMTRVGELTTCSIPEHTAYYQKNARAK